MANKSRQGFPVHDSLSCFLPYVTGRCTVLSPAEFHCRPFSLDVTQMYQLSLVTLKIDYLTRLE